MTAKVTFNTDRCKGCELCTTVCPKHIVVIDTTVINRKG
ncbi:MAG: 4Fe-4S binding protein, partial [Oscillospiraceae bacterium]|nr:4Fe-4S binding protein [Oscillospiraceae bacterium]